MGPGRHLERSWAPLEPVGGSAGRRHRRPPTPPSTSPLVHPLDPRQLVPALSQDHTKAPERPGRRAGCTQAHVAPPGRSPVAHPPPTHHPTHQSRCARPSNLPQLLHTRQGGHDEAGCKRSRESRPPSKPRGATLAPAPSGTPPTPPTPPTKPTPMHPFPSLHLLTRTCCAMRRRGEAAAVSEGGAPALVAPPGRR